MNSTEKYTILKYSLIAIFITAVLLIVLVAFFMSYEPRQNIEVGRVLSKSVLGVNPEGENLIAHHDSDGLDVLDEKYSQYFNSTSGNFSIDNAFEKAVLEEYSEIQYNARFRLCIRDITVEYSLDRIDFNLLRTGIIVKFEIDSGKRNHIRQLIEY
jgi:hypothetical protein